MRLENRVFRALREFMIATVVLSAPVAEKAS